MTDPLIEKTPQEAAPACAELLRFWVQQAECVHAKDSACYIDNKKQVAMHDGLCPQGLASIVLDDWRRMRRAEPK